MRGRLFDGGNDTARHHVDVILHGANMTDSGLVQPLSLYLGMDVDRLSDLSGPGPLS